LTIPTLDAIVRDLALHMARNLDAGRGVTCRRRDMRPLAHRCIIPVTGLSDRKRAGQRTAQKRRVQNCPAKVCIGSPSGSAGPSSLLRESILSRVEFTFADLTNISTLFSLFLFSRFVLDASSAHVEHQTRRDMSASRSRYISTCPLDSAQLLS
jgi:hypothetical protein